MNSESNRPSIFSFLGWGIVVTILICGLLAPSWILWLAVYDNSRDLLEYRIMLPMLIAALLPLFATHLYLRRLYNFVRWEIWFGGIQLVGWFVTSAALGWMLDPDRMAAGNGQNPYDGQYGYVIFSFAIWFLTPIIACSAYWVLKSIRGWWQRRKRKTSDRQDTQMNNAARKPITLRTLAIWMAFCALGLSVIFGGGQLAKEMAKKVAHPEASWVLVGFIIVSMISIVVYAALNLWLQKVRPYVIGWLFLLTFFPALPLLTPLRLSLQAGMVEGEAITRLCVLFLLAAVAAVLWRCCLHLVAPAELVERTSETAKRRFSMSLVAGKAFFVAMIVWLCLLAWWPISHFILRPEAASADALRRQMISVYSGATEEDNDWLDSFNRELGAGLDPDNNAVVDMVDLHAERLAVLKNAAGGMESLKEYFELLGVKEEKVNQWCTRINASDPPRKGIVEVGHRHTTSFEELWRENQSRLHESQLDQYADYDDGLSATTLPSNPDELSGYDLLQKYSVAFRIGNLHFIQSVSDKRLVEAFFGTRPGPIDRIPWSDEDYPLAKGWLAENQPYLEAVRRLARKDVYSPWIRLKEQPLRENYVFDDSLRPYNPMLLLRPLEPILQISIMNHVGNKDFEAAITDLESLARLHGESWLPSFTNPTDGRNQFAFPVNKVIHLALVLACHDEFPSELCEDLLSVVRLLPTVNQYSPPAIINLRSNLIADRYLRSTLVPMRLSGHGRSEGDPLLRFCLKVPEAVDWRFLAESIDQHRQQAIQTYKNASREDDGVDRRFKLIPITKTHFQDMFLTGPQGKGRAFASRVEHQINRDLDDWHSRSYLLSRKLKETAFYVELYRKLNAKYPEQLSDLSPGLLETLPQDPYSDGLLVYRTSGEGYKLYSIDRDEVDDGGDSQSDEVFERPIIDLLKTIKQQLNKTPASRFGN